MNLNAELQEKFMNDCLSMLTQYESILQKSERLSPNELNELFRIVHCIKGNAAALGFSELAQFAHRFENLISESRSEISILQNKPLLLQFGYKIKYFISFIALNKAA